MWSITSEVEVKWSPEEGGGAIAVSPGDEDANRERIIGVAAGIEEGLR
jgi:hypothetical protein